MYHLLRVWGQSYLHEFKANLRLCGEFPGSLSQNQIRHTHKNKTKQKNTTHPNPTIASTLEASSSCEQSNSIIRHGPWKYLHWGEACPKVNDAAPLCMQGKSCNRKCQWRSDAPSLCFYPTPLGGAVEIQVSWGPLSRLAALSAIRLRIQLPRVWDVWPEKQWSPQLQCW